MVTFLMTAKFHAVCDKIGVDLFPANANRTSTRIRDYIDKLKVHKMREN